jgi:hypothetical protein
VAQAAGTTIDAIRQLGDENAVMTKMSDGARSLTAAFTNRAKSRA